MADPADQAMKSLRMVSSDNDAEALQAARTCLALVERHGLRFIGGELGVEPPPLDLMGDIKTVTQKLEQWQAQLPVTCTLCLLAGKRPQISARQALARGWKPVSVAGKKTWRCPAHQG